MKANYNPLLIFILISASITGCNSSHIKKNIGKKERQHTAISTQKEKNNKKLLNENNIKKNKNIIIIANKLNIRSGPGIDYSIIGHLKKGDKKIIIKTEKGWAKLKDTEGWICEKYIISADKYKKGANNQNDNIKSKLTKNQINMIYDLRDKNYIRFQYYKGELLTQVFIDPFLWHNMKYSLKEDFATTLSIYIAEIRKTKVLHITFLDIYSGKKIAKWSEIWGLKTY